MIDYIVLSKSVNIFDALKLKNMFAMEMKDSSQAYTREFQKKGVSQLSVWIDKDKILEEPDVEHCTLNATIRTNKFVKNHTINIEKIISVLDEITCGIEVQDKEWKLQNVSFKFWMHCDSPKDYLEMLNQGSFQSKNGLTKEVDRKINPTELKFSSSSVVLRIKQVIKDNELEISMLVLKAKLDKLPDEYKVVGRSLKGFEDKFAKLEMYLWKYYLDSTFGMGDYYTYKKAESRINESSYSRTEKNNMLDILKGVSIYKGVEKYISHLGEEDNEYEFMQNVKTISTANKYLRMLRGELGINPVTIGRRTASNFFMPGGMVNGLATTAVVQEVHKLEIRGFKKEDEKQVQVEYNELPFD